MRRGTIKRSLAGLPMLADVTRPAVQRWHEANKDKAPETLKHSRDDMRGYWENGYARTASSPGWDSENNDPFDASKLSIAAESDEAKLQQARKSFTPAEIWKLQAQARKDGDAELADLITVAMWSGARLGELTSLRAASVNLKAQAFHVGSKTTAGFRQISINHSTLMPTMARLVKAAKGGALFPSGDKLGDTFTAMKTEMGFGSRHVFHARASQCRPRLGCARQLPSTS